MSKETQSTSSSETAPMAQDQQMSAERKQPAPIDKADRSVADALAAVFVLDVEKAVREQALEALTKFGILLESTLKSYTEKDLKETGVLPGLARALLQKGLLAGGLPGQSGGLSGSGGQNTGATDDETSDDELKGNKRPRSWRSDHRPAAAGTPEFTAFWLSLVQRTYRFNPDSSSLIFPDTVFVLGLEALGQALYVRPCYPKLLDIIVARWNEAPIQKKGIILSGNPGIGKSLFLCYVMLRAALGGHGVVYERRESNVIFICNPDGSVASANRDSKEFIQAIRNPEWFYLFDPAGKQETVEPLHGAGVYSRSLVVSSPNSNHFHTFQKWHHQHIYMPVWSLSEVEQARRLCHPTEDELKAHSSTQSVLPQPVISIAPVDAQARWDIFGGIVRYIFCTPAQFNDQYQQLLGMISQQRIEDVLSSVKELEQMDSVSHRVLHYIVNDTTFRSESVTFASDFIFSKLMENSANQLSDKLLQFITASSSLPIMSALRGYVFEKICHSIVAAGGQFKCRPLTSFAELLPEATINIPPLKMIKFSQNDDIHTIVTEEFKSLLAQHGGNQQAASAALHLLLRPNARNYSFADAIMFTPSPGVLQETVSKKHALKRSGCVELQHALQPLFPLNPPLHIYLLFPPDIYAQPRKQESFVDSKDHVVAAPNNVSQWALCVPLTPGTKLPQF